MVFLLPRHNFLKPPPVQDSDSHNREKRFFTGRVKIWSPTEVVQLPRTSKTTHPTAHPRVYFWRLNSSFTRKYLLCTHGDSEGRKLRDQEVGSCASGPARAQPRQPALFSSKTLSEAGTLPPLSHLTLCYIVPGTSFGERNGQHERTAREWRNPRFSGCCAVCFAVHFGIQTGSIG
jgi:hypothetical protein